MKKCSNLEGRYIGSLRIYIICILVLDVNGNDKMLVCITQKITTIKCKSLYVMYNITDTHTHTHKNKYTSCVSQPNANQAILVYSCKIVFFEN